MHDEDYDYDYGPQPVPSRKFTFLNLVVVTLVGFSSFIDNFAELLMAHNNWKVQRKLVEEEMRADLERIVAGG